VGDPLWKQTERRIARYFGGIRISYPYVKGVDVLTDWLAIEVKSRDHLPAWIKDAVTLAQRVARPNRLGIAVLHEKNSREDLVVLSIHDFRQWFGELNRKGVE
jgi:hypothetical protein